MPRYVDVENISKLFNEKYNETKKLISDGDYFLDNLAEGFTEADRIIRAMPTADVVEVVRCKDCKRYVLFAGNHISVISLADLYILMIIVVEIQW